MTDSPMTATSQMASEIGQLPQAVARFLVQPDDALMKAAAALRGKDLNQTGFTGEHKAWKVSHDQRKFREPFFDRSACACSAFGA